MRGGIDLGGTKIEAVIVDDGDQVVGRARRSTPNQGGPEDVAEQIVLALRDAAADAAVEPSALAGVGVGPPGTVDAKAGTVASAANLPGWLEPFPLAATLSSALGVPVRLGNDVGVAVDAETALGAGRRYRSFLGVWWGTGVGGAVVLDGKRWLGRGGAGEIGHTVSSSAAHAASAAGAAASRRTPAVMPWSSARVGHRRRARRRACSRSWKRKAIRD